MGLSRGCNIASARVVGLVAVVRLDRACWFCRVWLQQENAHVGGARDSKNPSAPFLLCGVGGCERFAWQKLQAMNGSFTTSISVHVSTWGNAELPIVQEAAIVHILQSFIAYKPCTASRSRALVTWGGETASDVQVHGMCSRMLTCSRMRASRLDVGFLMCNEN